MDVALLTREAVVVLLRNTVAVTTLIKAASIFGERVPDNRTYPYIHVAPPTVQPFRMSCHDGRALVFIAHVFTKGAKMNLASAAGAEIDAVLSERTLLLEGGGKIALSFQTGGIIPDPQTPDAWHWFGQYGAA